MVANLTYPTSIQDKQSNAPVTSEGGQGLTINFNKHQTRLVLEGLVTQVVLPYDPTENLEIGDKYPISFGGMEFNDSYIEIVNVKKTTVKQLGHIDAFKNGYSFKPFFIEHLKEQGFSEDDVVLKVDFRLIE